MDRKPALLARCTSAVLAAVVGASVGCSTDEAGTPLTSPPPPPTTERDFPQAVGDNSRRSTSATIAFESTPPPTMPASTGAGAATVVPSRSVPTAESSSAPELAIRPDAAAEAALTIAVESAIAQCMSASGFEYRFLTAAEYAEGITYRNYASALAFPLTGSEVESEVLGQPPALPDPNQAYIEGLTDSARQAFGTALNGDGSEVAVVSLGPGQSVQISIGGCRSAASFVVYGVDAEIIAVGSLYVANLAQIAHARTQADPELGDAESDWRACLKSAGYDVDNFRDARELRLTLMDAAAAQELREADFRCVSSSSLGEVYRSRFNQHFEEEYEQSRGTLDEFIAARTRAIQALGN